MMLMRMSYQMSDQTTGTLFVNKDTEVHYFIATRDIQKERQRSI